MTNRRTFLAGLFAVSTTPDLTWADVGNPSYLAAAKLPNNSFALFGLSDTGQDMFQIPLPGRGHAAAVHPKKPEVVAFARRPGRFALVIDCASGQPIQKLDAPVGRHFYGHGTFIHNGELLCTTENHIETGEGLIGVWSRAEQYRRIGEFSSGGIGPHELKTMPDEQTIVIANGGIKTHPDTGRKKLNLDSMRPNISIVNDGGKLQSKIKLDKSLHQNSIRHLDISSNGLIAFGMQWQGDFAKMPALVGIIQENDTVQLFGSSIIEQSALKNYIGSVAVSIDGQTIAVTAPKGNRFHLYDINTGFIHAARRNDICGVATKHDGFITTDGSGGIFDFKDGSLMPLIHKSRSWDNHLIKI